VNTRSIRFRMTVWYAGLLSGLLLLFGIFSYFGLEHYLHRTMAESLSTQAEQIGGLLKNVDASGETYVTDEVEEHLAPESTSRFVRITRPGGGTLFESGYPKNRTFDPAQLPPAELPPREHLREIPIAGGYEFMVYSLPCFSPTGGQFLVEVGAPDREINEVLHGLMVALSLALPLVVGASIGGGYLLMRRAMMPVHEIARSAEQIGSHNLSERLPVARTGDELERLSISLNTMIARLEHAFQHISRFTADASHELRTPLTVLRGELEETAQNPSLPSGVRDTVGSALEETERLSKIVQGLLAVSRLDAGEAEMERIRLDLAELAVSTSDQMKLLAEDKNISLSWDAPHPVLVEGDRARLRQVIVNLLDNAINYTASGGKIHLRVWSEGNRSVLEVEDNGAGISKEALPHIFERFYRTDKARSRQMGGAGLGLAIVQAICLAHGGEVRVESTEGRGSLFIVSLPLVDQGIS
jgi:heavy metal sensor kinase